VYLISFHVQPNGAYVFNKISFLDKILSICNEFKDQEVLELIEVNEGRDTLGIALALDRNMKDEINLLNKKIERWISAVKSKILPSDKIILEMRSMIIKTIEYPLVVTTFLSKELNRIVKPIHDLVLLRSNICRKLPHAL
jgi:hypothetical protein